MNKTKNDILSAEKKMTDAVEERIRELREHERVMKAKFLRRNKNITQRD